MAYTNSPLVCKTQLSSKHNDRKYPITKITIHHAAGVLSFDNLLNYVATCSRDMSANYVLRQGKLGLVVEEKYRAWTSSNAENDHKAVTIEVGNSSSGGQWPIADEDLAMLIKWCADVCKRNNIPKLYYDGTPNGSLTLHEMFAATGCPGPYIKSKIDYICTEVNKLINSTSTSTTTPSAPAATGSTTYKVVTDVYGYMTAADAVADTNRKRTVTPGTYYVYNETTTAVNVTLTPSVPGAWICKAKNVVTASTSTSSTSTTTLAAGTKLTLSNTKLYASATSTSAASTKSGTYYVYDSSTSNGRIRITNSSANVGKTPAGTYVTGWVAVSDISSTSSALKSVTEVAKEVIQGKWGNGTERKQKLEAAGYNYAEVQAAVNKML